MKVKPIKIARDLDLSKYVNIETGEVLSNIRPGSSVAVLEESDYVEIHYDEYINVDAEMLRRIEEKKILKASEIGHVLRLANTVRSEYNALFKTQKTVHTLESISEALGMTYDNARLLVNKLVKKGVLYKFSGYRDDVEFKAFLMNPFLARKRKNMHKECVSLFQQF